MPHSVVIESAPAYELVLSLEVFVARQRWKTIDLGTAWGTAIARRLGPEVTARLRAIDERHLSHLLYPLIHQSPEQGVVGFLAWFASLSPGEIYEQLVRYTTEEDRTHWPVDLDAWREMLIRELHTWNEEYFRHLDPAILEHLKADAEARRAQASVTPLPELIGEATSGLYLEMADLKQVLLVPQYHMRPWNMMLKRKDLTVVLYPVEPPVANPDEPPVALTRLTQALADGSRLRLLRFLAREPLNLSQLTERSGLAKSTVHHHMVALRAAGLVIVREWEEEVRYSLRPGWMELLSARLSAFIEPE
ncbi:MAG: ArsR family transcriptional regulator [Bacillota bacterium]